MKRADHERIQAVLDGTVTEIEFHHFQDALRQDPDLRRLYQSYALLHHTLAEEYHGQAVVGKSQSRDARSGRASGWMTGLMSAAAAIAILALAIWLASRRPGSESFAVEPPLPPAPLVIDFSPEAGWRVEGESTARDSRAIAMPGARLFLDKGVARLQFASDVIGHLEAPAEIRYENPGKVVLEEGRGRFRVGPDGKGFVVRTASLEAVDLGTEFAVVSHRSAPDELHVFEGQVEMRTPEGRERPLLEAGQAASVSAEGRVTRITARPGEFADRLPEFRVVLKDRFDGSAGSLHGRLPGVGRGAWEVRQGSAVLGGDGLTGGGFQAFCKLEGPALAAENPLLVTTIELAPTVAGPMHGPGWAGLSLYADGDEMVFFGDSFGEAQTWSLDVKQGLDPLLPEPRVVGRRVMTMVYDWRSGLITLHSGEHPGSPELVRGKIPARLSIDAIRIGASEDATISVRQVVVRLLGAVGQ